MKSTQRLSLELRPSWSCGKIWGSDDPEDPPKDDDKGANDSGDAGDKETGSTGNQGNPQAKIAALTEEKDRHFNARREAERELDELRKFKEKVDADKLSDAEKAAKAAKDQADRLEALAATNRRLAIENAFLADSSVKWVDTAAALKLSDLTKVEIDDVTGEIKNPEVIAEVIKATAKAKPYLVAAQEKDDDKEKETPPPGSGAAPGNSKVKINGLDTESLRQKFPALRSHL